MHDCYITVKCHTPGADPPCAPVHSAAAPVHISHISEEHRTSSHLSGMLLVFTVHIKQMKNGEYFC